MDQVNGDFKTLKAPEVGDLVAGRYRICRLLGAGGFGVVYHARQESMGRDVAIKVLQPNISRDPIAIERFRREAFFASGLRHPNTITIHDYGSTDEGLFYLVMEFLEGEPLAKVIFTTGGLTTGRALRIGAQILKSLGEAHQKGLVHRDLKPENIFLTEVLGEADFVRVLDFGLSKALEGGQAASANNDMNLTQEGMVFGTPLYMAPEQAYGEEVVPASDVFAFGLLLYEMLLGRRPFQGLNHVEILRKLTTEPLPRLPSPLDESSLQVYLDHVTEKEVKHRYKNAVEALPPLLDLLGGKLASQVGPLDELEVGGGRRSAARRPPPRAITPTTPVGGTRPRGPRPATPAPHPLGQRIPATPPPPEPNDDLFNADELDASLGQRNYERPKQDPRQRLQRRTVIDRDSGRRPRVPLGSSMRETTPRPRPTAAPPPVPVTAPTLPAAPAAPGPRRHAVVSEAPTVIASLTQVWNDIPIIGRDKEIARLVEFGDRLGRGVGGMAMVIGEAGVGKTRLIHEVRRLYEQRHLRVIQGDYVGPGGGAGTGLRRAIADLLGLDAVDDRLAVGRVAQRLNQLGVYAPDAARGIVNLIKPQAVSAEERWTTLSIATPATFQLLGQLLLAEARAQPLVLIIEDLQWADPFAAGFAEHMVRTTQGAAVAQGTKAPPLLCVVTLRHEAMQQSADLVNAFHRMGRHLGLGFERIDLPRLVERDIRRLIQHVIEPAEATQREVIRRSGGNPMYVLQAMRYLSTWTALSFQSRYGAGASAEPVLPATIAELVRARAEQIAQRHTHGPLASELLTLLSLLGLRFPYRLAEDFLVFLGRDDLVAQLDAILRDISNEGFLGEELAPTRVFHFEHQLIQEALLDGVNHRADRARLHEAAARAKEQVALGSSPLAGTASAVAALADVAHHWREAGDRGRMIEALMRQAQTAEQSLDLRTAQTIFGQLADEFERSHARHHAAVDVQIAIARLQIKLGEFGPAEDQLMKAADLAVGLNDSGLIGRTQVMLGKVLTWQSRYREALRCFRRAVNAYTNLTNTTRIDLAGLADAQLGQAEIARVRGDLDTAETELNKALQKAVQAQANVVRAHCLQALGRIDHVRGRLNAAGEHLAEARALFDQSGLLIESANVATDLSLVQLYVQGRAQAEATIREALNTLGAAGDPLAVATAEIHLGIILRRGHDLELARSVAEGAMKTFTSLHHQYGIAKVQLLLGEISFLTGAIDRASQLGREALTIHEAIGDAHGTALCLIFLGQWAMEQGKLDQSEAQIVHALDILEGGGILLYRAICQLHLGRLAELRGNIKSAQQRFSQAYNEARDSNNREVLAMVAARLGSHAFARGRINEARGYLQNSLSVAGELDLVECCALANFSLAWACSIAGKPVDALPYIEELRALRSRGFLPDVHLREHAAQISQAVSVVRSNAEAQQYRRAALDILQKM